MKGCHSEPLHSPAIVDRGDWSQRDGLSVARGAGVKGPGSELILGTLGCLLALLPSSDLISLCALVFPYVKWS